MDEKKLTDEEIVKALECCRRNEEENTCAFCLGCPASEWEYEEDMECHAYMMIKVIDLIHRLQDENIQLKRFVSGLEDEKKVESIIFGLKETIAEQKAEIERLAKVEIDLIGKIADKSAEIERLTEERGVYLDDCSAVRHKLRQEIEEKFELQKQVDELKELNAKYLDSIESLTAGKCVLRCELTKQAVKDTAKEILQELWDETEPNNESHKWVRLRIKNIATRKGVEVE